MRNPFRKKPKAKFKSPDTILGDLPDTWEFYPTYFPQATPGAIFRERIMARGTGPIPRRSPHKQFHIQENPQTWTAVETWVTDGDKFKPEIPGRYRLSTGRWIWRRHNNQIPRKKLP